MRRRPGAGSARAALALAFALAVTAEPLPAGAAPPRVMSLNVCTDQLALALLPPERITSVTWLARDPASSQLWRAARRVPVNHGLAEEVVRDRPDLVLAGGYTTPATRALLGRLHYPVLVLQPAESFDDIRRVTLRVADAVGERGRGLALTAHLDAALAALARDKGPPLRVAAWDEAGLSAGPGSLYGALLTAAGARDVAAEGGGFAATAPPLERLLAAAPQLLITGAPAQRSPGLHAELVQHPLVRRFWADRTLAVPLAAYSCGTPFSADAALQLQGRMRAAAARARTPLPYRAGWTR